MAGRPFEEQPLQFSSSRNLSNNRIFPNNRRKSINQILDIFLSIIEIYLLIIEIYLSNIHHHELNTNKSINRKIAIILTAKSNRIMLKEIFAKYFRFVDVSFILEVDVYCNGELSTFLIL